MSLSADTVAAFERLFADAIERGPCATIEYTLSAPKWQFLCYLSERKPVVLHGSGNPSIATFEPRKSTDVNEFGNRQAIYAAADGIWPIYFAIVDRDRPLTSLVNGCFRVVTGDGLSDSYYFFSIDADALPHPPWRDGTIYLLPDDTFERQPRWRSDGVEIESVQVASRVPVTPLAKLAVSPEEFPFLDQVRRHDPVRTRARAHADPAGFPWIDEQPGP
jgi:hypothetical protein